ncbi:MAG: ribulose-phosphate 3-epimerase [Dehalococcoidia bacterium]|nr:ribulose-phosphate 3-epimerase [Dehalococcoidia bacterium]
MANPTIKLAPSILSADFSRLGEAVAEATKAGVDYIHVDIMDGQFVPNITFGAAMVKALRPWTTLPLDVHLMVAEPERHIQSFADAGANFLVVHAEACRHLHRVVHQIKEAGVKVGVAINPGTPVSAVEEVLPDLDMVLVMSVNPGFPAQVFIPGSLDKIHRMRRRIDVLGKDVELEVDGGINESTAASVVKAGATVLVAGSAVFNQRESVQQAVGRLRRRMGEATG